MENKVFKANEALQLAMAKHLAKEALDKLKTEGVISSHTMASSHSFGASFGPAYMHNYHVRPDNKYSSLFGALFNRLHEISGSHAYMHYGSAPLSAGPMGAAGGSGISGTYTTQSYSPSESWTYQSTALQATAQSDLVKQAFAEGQAAAQAIQPQGFLKKLIGGSQT